MSLIHGNNIPPINLNQEPIPTYKIQWSSPKTGKDYTIEQLKSHLGKSSSGGKKTDVEATFQKINALADALFKEAAKLSSLSTTADNVSFNEKGHTAHSISGGSKTEDYKELKTLSDEKAKAVASIITHKTELLNELEKVVSQYKAEGGKDLLGKSMSVVNEKPSAPKQKKQSTPLTLIKTPMRKTGRKRKNPEQSPLFAQYKSKLNKIKREIKLEKSRGIEQENSMALKKLKKLETELSLPEKKFSSDETKELKKAISIIEKFNPFGLPSDSDDSYRESDWYAD